MIQLKLNKSDSKIQAGILSHYC